MTNLKFDRLGKSTLFKLMFIDYSSDTSFHPGVDFGSFNDAARSNAVLPFDK